MKTNSKNSAKKSAEKMGTITMTTAKTGKVTICMAGMSEFAIDWCDGSDIENYSFPENYNNKDYDVTWCKISRVYSDISPRTITITGVKIKKLDCSHNQITDLNVSKNIELTFLDCSGNQLTSLDVNQNPELTALDCNSNQFTRSALEALFETLNNIEEDKYIYIFNNPEAVGSDHSIAEDKGWRLHDHDDDFDWEDNEYWTNVVDEWIDANEGRTKEKMEKSIKDIIDDLSTIKSKLNFPPKIKWILKKHLSKTEMMFQQLQKGISKQEWHFKPETLFPQ